MIAVAAGLAVVVPAAYAHVPHSHLQCAPYARQISGINLRGNAGGWWAQASGLYTRGQLPRVGSVLAFRATHVMRAGHVAVVHKIVDTRHILLDHANWSRPGMIEHTALAEDVSPEGDWSQVRVWFAPIGKLGTRPAPAYGFIYPHASEGNDTLANSNSGTAQGG